MHDAGFTDVTTLECLQRVLDVRSVSVPVANLGYGAENSYCDIGAKPELGNEPVTGRIETVNSWCKQKPKKLKHISEAMHGSNCDNDDTRCIDADGSDEPVADMSNQTRRKAESSSSHKQPHYKASYNFKSALPVSQMTGHTGYLTFATLYPK